MKKEDDSKTTHKKSTKYVNLLIILAILIAGSIYSYSENNGSVSFDWTEEALSITDPAKEQYQIPYEQIRVLSLTELPESAECIDGEDGKHWKYGIWDLDSIGTCRLCVSASCDSVILIETVDSVYLFNYESPKTTLALYDYLREKTGL